MSLYSEISKELNILLADKYMYYHFLPSRPKEEFIFNIKQLLEENGADPVFELLKQESKGGYNFGHLIASHEDNPEVIKSYIGLLKNLANKDHKKTIALLKQQDKDHSNNNIGITIAIYQENPTVFSHFIDLISELIKKDPEKTIELLVQPNKNGRTIIESAYTPQYRSKITNALLDLPATQKTLDLLRKCLDKNTAFGKYCRTSTGTGVSSYLFKDGSTNMFREISNRIEQIKSGLKGNDISDGSKEIEIPPIGSFKK